MEKGIVDTFYAPRKIKRTVALVPDKSLFEILPSGSMMCIYGNGLFSKCFISVHLFLISDCKTV